MHGAMTIEFATASGSKVALAHPLVNLIYQFVVNSTDKRYTR